MPQPSKLMWRAIFSFTLFACAQASAFGTVSKLPVGILLTAGDIAGCDKEQNRRAAQTASVLAREIESAKARNLPVRVAINGDLAYDDGTESDFSCFSKSWGKILKETLISYDDDTLPVPGNHEYRTENGRWFFDYFANNRWVKANPGGYFSTIFPDGSEGAWQLIGLNSELEGGSKAEQETWLDGVLRASSSRCVLAFWHRPVFSSGSHGHDEGKDYKSGRPSKQAEMSKAFDLLLGAGASVVINGHDHDYEELAPHDARGQPAKNGVRGFVVGTGGRNLGHTYAVGWTSLSRNFDATTYGILKLELYPDSYKWDFLTLDDMHNVVTKYQGSDVCNQRKPPA